MERKVTIPNAVLLAEVDNLLKEGHTVVLLTKGNSMLPFIRGDRDSVELERRALPAVGDIALAQVAPGRYVLHRIILMEGDAVTLKGDGNLDNVEHCRLSDICGVALNIQRPDGKVIDCTTVRFERRSRFWRLRPRIVRRIYLGFYRRLAL